MIDITWAPDAYRVHNGEGLLYATEQELLDLHYEIIRVIGAPCDGPHCECYEANLGDHILCEEASCDSCYDDGRSEGYNEGFDDAMEEARSRLR